MLKGLVSAAVAAACLGAGVLGAEAGLAGGGVAGTLSSGPSNVTEVDLVVVRPRPRYYQPLPPLGRQLQGPAFYFSGSTFVAPAYYGHIVPGRCEYRRSAFFQRKNCEGTYLPIR